MSSNNVNAVLSYELSLCMVRAFPSTMSNVSDLFSFVRHLMTMMITAMATKMKVMKAKIRRVKSLKKRNG